MTNAELADVLANCPFHTDAGSPAIYRKVPEVIVGRIIAALRQPNERELLQRWATRFGNGAGGTEQLLADTRQALAEAEGHHE